MSCEYCKNKVKNWPVVVSFVNENEGVEARIVKAPEGTPCLEVFAWYDLCVGIGPVLRAINYCPMCGERLAEE